MKTLIGSLLALGLLSSAASAQWCPPGYGYGTSFHRPHASVSRVVVQTPAPAVAVEAPAAAVGAPIEPPALPAQAAPEVAPPK